MALPAAVLVLVRQVICSAHGHLEMLAEYPNDAINVFELLRLDPRKAPFYPPNKSYWRVDDQYQEVHDKVTQHHMEMLNRAKAGLRRPNPREVDYEKTLTMSASVLEQDGPRLYYLEVFLPMLEKEIEGKPRECVWSLVHAFHLRECGETWEITGMRCDRGRGTERESDRIGGNEYIDFIVAVLTGIENLVRSLAET
ncbi:hypothetical protein F5144DRAFT_588448 [Chaetomium tenue]|uniref:Uncharacterized protein n=1 Tax=Chaetomium tenue TaxID=1854479 RepID=A0ACB7PNB5_9PEZI|nr:hypothetical protein F5144DRAFT_588448 [Chaetomium globosum]